ncbi:MULTISPECIES: Arc family DNA-binding protein [Chromobacterium]|uniref:Arc family DNA-binding protein n=1 Tax=Chromobacterium TaxID=535 RepID=UPI001D07BD7A|nr:Arc family DNA-binding protein [Chromobacterium rhizoryzae]
MPHVETEIYRSQYRLPKTIAEWLKAEAAANFRSVNAELLAILHEAMQRRSAVEMPLKKSQSR